MTTKEVIDALAKRGISITAWRLRGLIDRGIIQRPRLNSALSFDWSQADLDALIGKLQSRAVPA